MINKVFGTGGIGTGIFFNLEGNRTMGREETRLGFLTDNKDYCKAHIILHYISMLTENIDVYAIGMVGNDEHGNKLITEMESAGIDTRYIEKTNEAPTMLAICYQYPDGAGGNITPSNSACNLVTPEYIKQCTKKIDKNSLVLAAPEVSLESRIELLKIGKNKDAFTVSSFLAEEALEFEQAGGFDLSDMISINATETEAVSNLGQDSAAEKILKHNPNIILIMTSGSKDIRLYHNNTCVQIPCIKEKVVSTAGAGDALLGGTIAALIKGDDIIQAVKYGTVIARFSVLSKNTIAENVTIENVEKYYSACSSVVT